MKKMIVNTLLFFPILLIAYQRKVVFEIATGTWCQYCPRIARAVDSLKHEAKDTLIVIEYHSGDPFANNYSSIRIGYYGITGYPTTMVDGIFKLVGANYDDSLRSYFDRRKIIPPYADILLKRNFSLKTMQGTLHITVKNINDFVLTGNVRTVITETNIPYEWFDEDSLYFVARTMIPDEKGDYVEIEPGDSVVIEHEFYIDTTWFKFTNIKNCEIDVFLQTDNQYGDFTRKEILQGAFIPVAASPKLTLIPNFQDNQGNSLGGLKRGDTTYVIIGITPQGDPLNGLRGTLRTTDERVTIIDSLGSWNDIPEDSTGYNHEDPFAVFVSKDAIGEIPFTLYLESDNGFSKEKDLSLNILGIVEKPAKEIAIWFNNSEVVNLPFTPGKVYVSIYDLSGRNVYEKVFYGTEMINIDKKLKDGVYFIQVKSSSFSVTKKVLKIGG